jgi:hypothetical protein
MDLGLSGGTTREMMEKVLFNLEPGVLHGSATETLWAEKVGHDAYQLQNTPFYAKGISLDDTIIARFQDGIPVFDKVLSAGGHSTYRIIVSKARWDDFQGYWNPIRLCGCSFEEGQNRLLAMDVPAEADIHTVYKLLEDGESNGVWTFEEGHCGHATR